MLLTDATELNLFTPYQWKDWCCVKSSECLFFWNEYIVVELSGISNGWFRYFMNGKVATMYSSGSVDGSSDSLSGKSDFVDKMQQCCTQVTKDTTIRPILSTPLPNVTLIMGNWIISCEKEGELVIKNTESPQVYND